jgi:nitroreductase
MRINRRRFLKTALSAGAVIGSGSFSSACYGLGKTRLYRDPPGDLEIKSLDGRRMSILYHASLAPSGHNSQPWTVRIINENEWIIGIDERRHLPATDPDNRIILLSVGAFVENLCLAAGAMGLHADTEIIAKESSDGNVLRIQLSKAQPSGYPIERMNNRMTAKKGYLSREISGSDVDAFSKLLGGNLFYFPRGTSHATCIEEGAVENFRIQARRDDAQKELVSWLRLREKHIEQFRDGLTVDGMEIRGIKGWFVRHFVHPEDFLKESFKKQSIDHTALLAGQGGGWFIITSDGHSVSDIIDAGRKFERMALAARERGIALQPMTQYLEEKHGLKQIGENHGPAVIPQFVIRVGYLDKYPYPVSPRRPVSRFVS